VTTAGWQKSLADVGQRIPAPLILIAALVILQVSSGMAKTIMTQQNAAGLAFVRVSLGAFLFWAVIRPPVKSFGRRQWLDAGMLGVVLAAFTLLIYVALTMMPLGLAVTIGFLGPLSVSLLHTRRAIDLLWPLLGFGGVYLLAPSTENTDVTWQAMTIALAYAFTWALYILASARAGRSMQGLDGFTVASAIAAVLLLPTGLGEAAHFFSTPYLVMMTIVVTLLITVPLGMEFLVLKRIEPRVFGVLLSLEPAIASVVGIILLQEFLSLNSWVAIGMVTAASIGVTLVRPSARTPASDR
jgi:inner membrane transporter RhtA